MDYKNKEAVAELTRKLNMLGVTLKAYMPVEECMAAEARMSQGAVTHVHQPKAVNMDEEDNQTLGQLLG